MHATYVAVSTSEVPYNYARMRAIKSACCFLKPKSQTPSIPGDKGNGRNREVLKNAKRRVPIPISWNNKVLPFFPTFVARSSVWRPWWSHSLSFRRDPRVEGCGARAHAACRVSMGGGRVYAPLPRRHNGRPPRPSPRRGTRYARMPGARKEEGEGRGRGVIPISSRTVLISPVKLEKGLFCLPQI